MLRAVKLPEVGGDTLFASMEAGFDALSAKTQAFVDGLTALHDGGPNLERAAGLVGSETPSDPVVHPVIRRHPDTGTRCVFVNRLFTTHILGLTAHESAAVLAALFEHLEKPKFQCRFLWKPGSVAFWDNRCTQHLAIWDYFPETRHGYRVTIKGDKPYFQEQTASIS